MRKKQKKSRSPSRIVRRLDEKRDEKERQQRIAARRAKGIVEHWYEVIEYFDPTKIETVDMPAAQGYRTFVHGVIDELTIVEVPNDMPNDQVRAYGEELGRMGLRVLLVSSNVRFMKLRPCSIEECELFDETDSEKKGTIFARLRGSAESGDGPRSEPDSDRAISGESTEDEAAEGAADHNEVERADGSAASEDP